MTDAEEFEITIRVTKDGDEWCSLVGDDLQSGIAAFEKTPSESLRQLFIYLADFPTTQDLAERLREIEFGG